MLKPAQQPECAGIAGSGAHDEPQTAVNWLVYAPGTKIDVRREDNTWDTGWMVKTSDKTSGEHEAWKYPDLMTIKCKLRVGMEIRLTEDERDIREAL